MISSRKPPPARRFTSDRHKSGWQTKHAARLAARAEHDRTEQVSAENEARQRALRDTAGWDPTVGPQKRRRKPARRGRMA